MTETSPDSTSGETADPKSPGDLPRENFFSHLKVLRRCLLVSLIAAGIAFLAVFFGFSRQLMEFLESPLKTRGVALIYITLYEPILIQMKASFIAAIVLASPIIICQTWSFLKPALYPKESRTVVLLFFVTLLLFLSGAAFAYLIVFRLAVNFFLVSGEGIASPFISIEKYVDFLFSFILPFGLIFELPVVMGILTRAGMASPALFAKIRRYMILAVFVVAAILTPPDVISQLLLALPLLVLFEAGIVVAKVVEKRRQETTEG
jgi:sec-independent protein translocase protein TatC